MNHGENFSSQSSHKSQSTLEDVTDQKNVQKPRTVKNSNKCHANDKARKEIGKILIPFVPLNS